MKNVLIVFNNNAGRRQSIKYKKAVINFVLKENCTFKTISIDEFEKFLLNDFDTIIVIGGDGTVSKVAQRLINTDINLAIIPSGTANLLAENLMITSNLKRALMIIRDRQTKNIDVIKVNNQYSVLRLGFGFDSDIICKTPQSLKNKFGYFSYFIAGILFALRLKQKEYNLIIDGELKKIKATCLIIANASNMYRKFFKLANNSFVDDNLIDIFILKTTNPILFFFELVKIFFNKRNNNIIVEYTNAKTISIKNEFCNCHIDGEKAKFKEDIFIENLPNKLKIISKN